MSAPLRIGTRASALALWQTEHVRARLHAAGHETVRVEIRTTGDMVQQVPLSQIGSRALFTRQIDDAKPKRRTSENRTQRQRRGKGGHKEEGKPSQINAS